MEVLVVAPDVLNVPDYGQREVGLAGEGLEAEADEGEQIRAEGEGEHGLLGPVVLSPPEGCWAEERDQCEAEKGIENVNFLRVSSITSACLVLPDTTNRLQTNPNPRLVEVRIYEALHLDVLLELRQVFQPVPGLDILLLG